MSNFKEEMDNLQTRMVEQALVFKDTEFDPFFRFIIGELDYKDCVEQVAKNLKK